MSRLHDLHLVHGQSPWLDNLRRGWMTSGELGQWIDRGVRGLTSNPTIFAKAMAETDDYDRDLRRMAASGTSVGDAYWRLVTADIERAVEILAPIHTSSAGEDGWVSVEVSPLLAQDVAGTVAAATSLRDRIAAPNLYLKVPATVAGVAATETLIADGCPVNATLIFGLRRYAEVAEAYLRGLERRAEADPAADLGSVCSVASFFISRVDVEVDRRLDAIGSPAALALRGQAAVAQAQLAYQQFRRTFAGARWERLAARGARLQRPLWASTSAKNPSYPDTLYVDRLIGPDTVNTLPDATLAAFEDHGTLARTVDADPGQAAAVIEELAGLGIDMEQVAAQLEEEGVSAFAKSFDEALSCLGQRADGLTER